jgi:hypothetical protein
VPLEVAAGHAVAAAAAAANRAAGEVAEVVAAAVSASHAALNSAILLPTVWQRVQSAGGVACTASLMLRDQGQCQPLAMVFPIFASQLKAQPQELRSLSDAAAPGLRQARSRVHGATNVLYDVTVVLPIAGTPSRYDWHTMIVTIGWASSAALF